MLTGLNDLLRLVVRLYPDGSPSPLPVLQALQRVQSGEPIGATAREARTTAKRLEALVAAGDPVEALLGCSLNAASSSDATRRPRAMLGQLLLGELAERAFESIYKSTVGTEELQIEDDRHSRNDTDYRVLNGERRPVFRINIKFHGTLFRKARELVGLDPEDCFALATYKVHQGLLKQENERLPYIFAIVSAPGLTGERVGALVPEDLVHFVALVHSADKLSGKRAVEERVVRHLVTASPETDFGAALRSFKEEIAGSEWRVLSARRADLLLRDRLFDRVYAVRVRAFARNYRNAELDMHFSLRDDLTSLQDFLGNLRERGLHGLTVDLERGVV